MKKIIYLLAGIILVSSGCNEWLDVSPRQEIKEKDMFSDQNGYRSALIGVYIRLASSSLLGKNTSYFFPEYLAHNWRQPESGTINDAMYNWEYNNALGMISSIWNGYYNVISQLNSILGNIDNSNTEFHPDNYHIIKGEAFGLRAFIHFELLRYFGPVPLKAVDSAPAIPYVDEMTREVSKLLLVSYGEVKEKIVRDLDSAQVYLAKVDPILYATNAQLNYETTFDADEKAPLDDWFFYRQRRFNYYTVLGVKARFYNWTGDKNKALQYAAEVIDSNQFRLQNNNDYVSSLNTRNLVMQVEHLFAVHNLGYANQFLDFGGVSTWFTQEREFVNTAFEGNTNDTRFGENRYWEEETERDITTYYFRKYYGNVAFPANYLIPIIRLSEMYLIMLEQLPFAESRSYWSDFLDARNLPASLLDEPEELWAERIEKEYRKEFYGEGQMFFFYKRHNYAQFTWPEEVNLPEGAYVLPLPTTQTDWEDGIITMD